MDAERLEGMVTYIRAQKLAIDSVTVVRHGYLLFDTYFPPFVADSPHVLHSCTKSVTSILVGMAIEQKAIQGVQQPVLSFFPTRKAGQVDERKSAMTLEHLLTMTDGLEWKENVPYESGTGNDIIQMEQENRDWVQYVLDKPMAAEPGTVWNYNGGSSHLLSAIVQQATAHISAVEFAHKHLFQPLGISNYKWAADPMGRTIGFAELYLTSRDMAKIGYLYLNKGRWENVQLVPSEWVEASTTDHSPTPLVEYGYQWWINSAAGYYDAAGRAGQNIFVVPKLDLVVAFTSHLEDTDPSYPGFLLGLYVLPAAR